MSEKPMKSKMCKGRASTYRFTKGTKVFCRTSPDEWRQGVVVALDYRESHWPRRQTVPYQVKLTDGRLIFVPEDDDELCRRLAPPAFNGRASNHRFTKGTKVLCCTGPDEWLQGVVVAMNYRESNWPLGKTIPYQVRLNNGRLFCVPEDVDEVCRKLGSPMTRGRASTYRFTKGTKVLCRTGPYEWRQGVVVAMSYREPDWPPWKTVPYQVQLNDGRLFCVPADEDNVCRKILPSRWDGGFKKTKQLCAALIEAMIEIWLNPRSAIDIAASLRQDSVQLLVDENTSCQDQDLDHDPGLINKLFGGCLEQKPPLHDSGLNADGEAAAVLLEAKANVDIQEARRKSPLQFAIEKTCMIIGNFRYTWILIHLLFPFGADTNLGNHGSGMDDSLLVDTPSAGEEELVKEPIVEKTDVKKRGSQRRSALHLAARSRHPTIAEAHLATRPSMNQESADDDFKALMSVLRLEMPQMLLLEQSRSILRPKQMNVQSVWTRL